MKGYFSQLAHRTGISFSKPANAAGRVASEPAVTAAPKASAAPIEVEEVTFTASSPSAGLDVSTSNISGASGPNETFTSPTSAIADANQDASLSQPASGLSHDTPVITVTNHVTAPPESRSQFVFSEPQTSATEQISFGERPFDQSQPYVNAESQALTEEPETIEVRANESRHQPSYEVRDVSVDLEEVQSVELTNTVQSLPPTPANVKEGKPLEQDRRRIFQDQLKEVMAWITSPPDEVEQSPQAFEVIEAQPEAGNVFAREREQGRSPERPSSAKEPQVQDLSLSIGTISIVVEEPKQDHPVSLTPPPPTQQSPQPVAPEPTRLSRYYLRNL